MGLHVGESAYYIIKEDSCSVSLSILSLRIVCMTIHPSTCTLSLLSFTGICVYTHCLVNKIIHVFQYKKMSVATSGSDGLQLVTLKGLDSMEERVSASSQDQQMARNTSRAR